MSGMIKNELCLDTIRKKLPTLTNDIRKNTIRKYTKYGIYSPDEIDLKYISKLKENGLKVLTIINSSMYYKDVELEVINYIYISKNYAPTDSIKGLKIEALVKNKTWNIESSGIICIDEVNGNLVRVY